MDKTELKRQQLRIGKKVREMITNGYSDADIAKEIGIEGVTEEVIRKVREKEETH